MGIFDINPGIEYPAIRSTQNKERVGQGAYNKARNVCAAKVSRFKVTLNEQNQDINE